MVVYTEHDGDKMSHRGQLNLLQITMMESLAARRKINRTHTMHVCDSSGHAHTVN